MRNMSASSSKAESAQHDDDNAPLAEGPLDSGSGVGLGRMTATPPMKRPVGHSPITSSKKKPFFQDDYHHVQHHVC